MTKQITSDLMFDRTKLCNDNENVANRIRIATLPSRPITVESKPKQINNVSHPKLINGDLVSVNQIRRALAGHGNADSINIKERKREFEQDYTLNRWLKAQDFFTLYDDLQKESYKTNMDGIQTIQDILKESVKISNARTFAF